MEKGKEATQGGDRDMCWHRGVKELGNEAIPE